MQICNVESAVLYCGECSYILWIMQLYIEENAVIYLRRMQFYIEENAILYCGECGNTSIRVHVQTGICQAHRGSSATHPCSSFGRISFSLAPSSYPHRFVCVIAT